MLHGYLLAPPGRWKRITRRENITLSGPWQTTEPQWPLQPTLLKSIRFCFIDVRWLLTAFDFQILKTTTCTLSYKTLKILSTFCSLVWKIRENLKILFSKIWPDRTDSCNIMCIWVKSPGEFKNLDLSKVSEHRTSSSLLGSLKLSCTGAGTV